LPELTDSSEVIRYFKENESHLSPFDPKKPDDFYTEDFWKPSNCPNSLALSPHQNHLLDDTILLRVHHEFAFEPVKPIRADWRAHFDGLFARSLWSAGCFSKDRATCFERFSNG